MKEIIQVMDVEIIMEYFPITIPTVHKDYRRVV